MQLYLEETYSESHESEGRERTRREDSYEPRRRYDDEYEDYDYKREEARGRGMRGRY